MLRLTCHIEEQILNAINKGIFLLGIICQAKITGWSKFKKMDYINVKF